MASLSVQNTDYKILLWIIIYLDRCNTNLLIDTSNIWKNKKMVRWLDWFEYFFLSRNSLIARKVGKS